MRLTLNVRGVRDHLGVEEAARLVKKVGFDAIDYSLMDMTDPEHILLTDAYADEAMRIREAFEKVGLPIVQTHTPFAFKNRDDVEYRNSFIIPAMKRSVAISGLLGAEVAIVHPFHFKKYPEYKDEMHDLNMELYRELLPVAEEYGVRIAVENMFGWDARRERIVHDVCSNPEEFVSYVDELNSDFAVACLDVGHVGLPTGTAYEAQDFVRALGHHRLKSLHIHDNDYKWDLHQMPYRGKLDWDSITAALGEINYDGDFTYEVDFDYVERAKASGGLEMLEAELVYMEKVGRILVDKIEKSRIK